MCVQRAASCGGSAGSTRTGRSGSAASPARRSRGVGLRAPLQPLGGPQRSARGSGRLWSGSRACRPWRRSGGVTTRVCARSSRSSGATTPWCGSRALHLVVLRKVGGSIKSEAVGGNRLRGSRHRRARWEKHREGQPQGNPTPLPPSRATPRALSHQGVAREKPGYWELPAGVVESKTQSQRGSAACALKV